MNQEYSKGKWLRRRSLLPLATSLGLACMIFQPRGLLAQTEGSGTLRDLMRSCASSDPAPCDVTISSLIQTQLSGRESLPRHIHLHFTATGSWTLNGGTLDFGGGTIDAPPDRHIFFGEGNVTNLESTRPEWFTDPVDDAYPAASMRKAYQAVQPGGSILLRQQGYLSPFFDPFGPNPCGGNALPFAPSVTLVGSGRPLPDVEDAPGRLVKGTVLRGSICGAGKLRASHLGVDDGPWVVKHDFHGKEAYGIQIYNTGALGSVDGTTLDDVSVLTTNLESQHSVIIEGQRNATVSGLWIWTLGGTHGLVMKSYASTIRDFHCKGAVSDCLILKSDYATNHAGRASDDYVDGVFLSFLKTPGDTGGIFLDARWDALRGIRMEHIREDGLSYGLAGVDSLFYKLSDLQTSDWTATHMEGVCLLLHTRGRVTIENFLCSEQKAVSGGAMLLLGSKTVLRNGSIVCRLNDSPCVDPRNDGVVDAGKENRIDGLRGNGLGGMLVRTSPTSGGTHISGIDASAMAGRATSIWIEPKVTLKQRIQNFIQTTKPLLRILWTHIVTAARSSNGTSRFLLSCAPVVAVMALMFWFRRPSRR